MDNSATHEEDEWEAAHISYVCHVYLMPAFLIIGLIGQSLNLVTLNQPSLRGVSFLYLKAIAVADILSIFFLVPFIMRKANVHNQHSYLIMFYHAHLELPIVNSFLGASSFCILGLTVERYLSICYPAWSHRGGSTYRLMGRIIILLYLLSMLIYLPSVIQKQVVQIEPGKYALERGAFILDMRTFKVYILLRELITRIVPIIALAILNMLIMRAFRLNAQQHRRLTGRRIEDRRSTNGSQRDIYDAEWRVYILIVVTTITFIVNTLPASVLSLLIKDSLTHSRPFEIFRGVANLLQVTSYMLNFYIYCLCSADYRRAFWQVITCSQVRKLANGALSELRERAGGTTPNRSRRPTDAQILVTSRDNRRPENENLLQTPDCNFKRGSLSPKLYEGQNFLTVNEPNNNNSVNGSKSITYMKSPPKQKRKKNVVESEISVSVNSNSFKVWTENI